MLMVQHFGPSIFVVDQVAASTSTSISMLLGFGPFVFVVDQITTSTSILMLLGFGPFVFYVDQITTSTSTSILMLLGFGPFCCCRSSCSNFLGWWVGQGVGVFWWVCFCR